MIAESQGKQYAIAISLSTTASIAVALRFYCRRKLRIPLLWDDWLTLLALLFTIILGILMVVAAANGHLGQHTKIGPHGPIIDEGMKVFSRTLWLNQLVQLLAVGLTKLSVILFYRRIFTGIWFNRLSWVLIGITTLWTASFFFTNLFQCIPLSLSWNKHGAGDGCMDEVPMYLAQSYSDVIIDALILALPVPWIWRLKMRSRTKVAITAVFFLGALTITASCAKMVVQYFIGSYLLEHLHAELIYLLTPIVYWPMIEASLGVIAACLPTLRPLFKGWSVERFIAGIRSSFTLRSSNADSSWERNGALRDGDADSSSRSTDGFNRIYKSGNSSRKLETNVEIVVLKDVKVQVTESKGIMVEKNFKRVDEII